MRPLTSFSLVPKWHRQILPYQFFLPFSSTPTTNVSHGFYDSHYTNISTNEASTIQDQAPKKHSARTEFRSIPFDPSILNSIEDIGVGLRPMHIKSRYMKTIRATRRKLRNGDAMDENDERNILRNRQAGSKTISAEEPSPNSSYLWTPLLPFGTILPTHLNNHSELLQRVQIKKLPIKVLGSIGSRDDELPRSTKGLPEIAIAGRSNVGKSTLLNALLYGNQFSSASDPTRKFIRGKTPEGAKLPKGPKAIVSDLPGETKRITFYQVSTQLSLAEPNTPHSEGNVNGHLGNIQTIPQEKAQKSDRSARNGIKEKGIQEKGSDHSTHSGIKEKENVSLLLIDLPGYGFAYTSDERMNEWKDLMHHFLVERGHMLKRILLLVDARHGFKKADFDFLDTLQQSLVSSSNNYNTNGGPSLDERETEKNKHRVEIKSLPPIQVVLTKCDLVQQKDLARRVVQVKRQLSDSLVRESKGALPVMLVSAKAGLGYNNIRGSRARGGILELQRELASIAPRPKLITNMIKTKKPIAPVVNKQIKRR